MPIRISPAVGNQQITLKHSPAPQLCDPKGACGQSLNLVSVPKHDTSSNPKPM